jgi:hypothetical protein
MSKQKKVVLGSAQEMNLPATELDFQTTDELQALNRKLDSKVQMVVANLASWQLA